MIENLAKMAGMPVGPLSLNDEVGIDLALKVLRATEQQVGAEVIDPAQRELLVTMVEKEGRLGRKNARGFYDYPEKGKGPKRLWPGLAALQATKLDPDSIDRQEIRDRLLVTQALEAARTVEEGVALARKLEAKHGPRFKPNKLLVEMAETGGTFYGRAEEKQAA
jgi:3-hydroxyacyl-CoA dehydrogenase/enoyl-CoA hydratase/3-hydroxybutyryl-CoA epimerase